MDRKIFVNYNDNVYGYGYDEQFMILKGLYSETLNDEEADKPIAYGTVFTETDNLYKLAFNAITFDTKTLAFNEEETFSFEFDKNTGEGKTVNLPEKLITFDGEEERRYSYRKSEYRITYDSVDNIILYVAKVVSTNANMKKFFTENSSLFIRMFGEYSYSRDNNITIMTANTLRFITENLIELEKLVTSGNSDFVWNLLKTPNAKLQKGKKLHQVIDLPKIALDYIKEEDMMAAKPVIQNIASEYDGNTLKIIIDMMNYFKPYEKYDSKRTSYWNKPEAKKLNFFENVYYLLGKSYKISDLLNYLLKQRMYWSDKNFAFPYDEAKTLVDYISICEKYSLSYEKYPQNLTKYHDIVTKNIKVLESDDSKKEAFTTAVNDYYSKDIEIGDYVFTAPTSIESLVAEGDSLHHCIGNYSDSIINGVSRIFFMREKKDPKKSFVTLELNKYNDLVEFKGDYNKEPSDAEVKTAINDFVKKVKKGGK